jgi:hemolysin III
VELVTAHGAAERGAGQHPVRTAAFVKPVLRGLFHQVAFFVAIPAFVILLVAARTGEARVAAVVYGLGVCALYGVSSSYHRFRWSPSARERMKRADHGTIFVMIAATYTPVCLLVLRGSLRVDLLLGVWLAALTGLLLALSGVAQRRGIGFILYLAMGWLAAIALPELLHKLGGGGIALLVTGGLLYTVGAVVLASRRPDPFPRVFGYHEVWHSMVIAASACHWFLIFGLMRAA